MYCPKCGSPATEDQDYCNQCGQALTSRSTLTSDYTNEGEFTGNEYPYDRNELNQQAELAEDRDWIDFVGEKYPYYKKSWAKSDRPESAVSWNWSAFLLGVFWLGYRKMYQPIVILLGIYLAFDLLEFLTNFNPLVTVIVGIIPGVVFALLGLYGNALYYRHAKKQINKIQQLNQGTHMLTKKGNTSGWGALSALGLLIVYAVIYMLLLLNFMSGTIHFGTGEGTLGVIGVKNSFTTNEMIYYEADFGETADTTQVDVQVIYHDQGTEMVYAEFEENVVSDWTGYYNYLYDPSYDQLDPGKYTVRVYRNTELLSEGSFEINELR